MKIEKEVILIKTKDYNSIKYLMKNVMQSGIGGVEYLSFETEKWDYFIECVFQEKHEWFKTLEKELRESVYIKNVRPQSKGIYKVYKNKEKVIYLSPEKDYKSAQHMIIKENNRIKIITRFEQYSERILTRVIREMLFRILENNNYIAVHGSAVSNICLVGDSGAGKSTLALALAESGLGYLANDKVLLKIVEDRVKILGFPSAIRVKKDTLIMLEVAIERLCNLYNLIPKDFDEQGGKVDILYEEAEKLFNINIEAETNLKVMIYPVMNTLLSEVKLTKANTLKNFIKNVRSPYDELYPDDWLEIRKLSDEKIRENVSKISNYILTNIPIYRLEYPGNKLSELVRVIRDVEKKL